MESVIIKDSIEIENSCLGPKLKEHIENAIKKKYIGMCSQTDGIIQNIEKIHKISDCMISRITNNPVFKVSFIVSRLKPTEGTIVEIPVTFFTSRGVVCKKDKINILIPSKELPDYVFKSSMQDSFNHKGVTYKIKENIKIKLVQVKYDPLLSFSALGTIEQ